ncbi:MAG: ABC transporter ATP-binding protein [Halobacteria archaeon]|nr:ABC transporter ATP-binding protein [Halobacteria archaeon]
MTDPLLSVSNLKTYFHTQEGTVKAVDDVSFDVNRGETVCLVGESGAGKTVTCESITKLISMPPGEIVGGEIVFDGTNLTQLSEKQVRKFRGDRIAYIFQNPQNALDPVYTIGDQIKEAVQYHQNISDTEAKERAIELLNRVGIPKASTRIDDYPHEFSGGMKQRVVIAIALAGDPDLLIADEPTTALDVTIESQILDLIQELQDERDMSILFITHDLGVVAEIADRVVVMYAGKVMEKGDVYDVFKRPSHPYTQALLRCLPGQGKKLEPIGGTIPDPTDPPEGCRFHPRCPHAIQECEVGEQPELIDVRGEAQKASCVFYQPHRDSSVVRSGIGSEGSQESEAEEGKT